MNSLTAPAPSLVERETRASVRLLRAFALLGLALIATLLLGLALLSSSSTLSDAISTLFTWEHTGSVTAVATLLAFIVLVPIVLLALAWRLRLRSWWWIGGGYLAAAPVLVYLAIDDATIRRPVSIEEIAPAFPGAEKSFAVLMRYGKNQPLAREFKGGNRMMFGQPPYIGDPSKTEAWRTWLLARRTDIEADWADLAPVRAWWAELNTFDRIGDLTPASYDAEIMAFAPVRIYSQHAIAIAGLQAIEGRGDDAVATLLPLLQVGRRLQPSARTLVRFMIGIVLEKMAIQTAGFILEQTAVSPEMKAKLAAALEGGCRGEAGARRLIGIEYSFQLGVLPEKSLGELFALMTSPRGGRDGARHALNLISPFVYNTRRTVNLMGDVNSELQELAARRQSIDAPRAAALIAEKTQLRFKNFVGSIIADRAVPSFYKVADSYWKVQEMRDALAARLKGVN